MESVINRRVFFKFAATGVTGYFLSPMELFPQSTYTSPATILNTAKYCIFVMLPGAPSQIDTFDLHIGNWTPANFAATAINGIVWPGGLMPALGGQLSQNRFSIIRSCQSTALVHALLQQWTQIARNPTSATGKIAPNIGAVAALELDRQRRPDQKLPPFIALNGGGTLQGAGYLPGRYAPFDVAPNPNGIANLANPDGQALWTTRSNTLQLADATAAANSPFGARFEEMADFYASARTMMYDTNVTNAFRFDAADQMKYGNNAFGNACLTARNLVWSDQGVRYIQLTLGGWDNHNNIYPANGVGGIYTPARTLDVALANLLQDLSGIPGSNGRSKLDETLIVVKGEFGRTIGNITGQQGRDHYFVHSALVAGGGVQGGRVIGSTTPDGAYVEDPGWSQGRPIYAEDFAATIYSALGIDYTTIRRDDPLGRGFEYVPQTGAYIGQPILELFR
jgi:hypothetical protein